jgi:acetyl-CoA synthetase
VTSGYNVGPSEVEGVILSNAGVAEVAVVAAPEPGHGTVVRAVVVADGTVAQDELAERIRQSVRDTLGRHAYPRVIEFAGELPKTETGKIRRNVLRDQYSPAPSA